MSGIYHWPMKPQPIIIAVVNGKQTCPYGWPPVAQIETEIPVKHPELVMCVGPRSYFADYPKPITIGCWLKVAIGDARALYLVSGLDLCGNFICDLIGHLDPTGLTIVVPPSIMDYAEVRRLLGADDAEREIAQS